MTGCGSPDPGPLPPGTADSTNWRLDRWRVQCRFDAGALPEISGLAPSLRHPHVLWAINDSGHAPQVIAIDDRTCRTLATVEVDAEFFDVEALASGRNRDTDPVLWVGDFGDNLATRRKPNIWEVPEPDLEQATATARGHLLRFPDGAVDAESLMAEPGGRHLVVITKALTSTMYRAPVRSRRVTLRPVGTAPAYATDAALTLDGKRFAVRTYFSLTRYLGPPPGTRIGAGRVPNQGQGEALSFSADGRWLFSASEGDPRLFRAQVISDGGTDDNDSQ